MIDYDETKNKLTQILGRRIRLKGSRTERLRQLVGICERNNLDSVLVGDL